MFCEHRDVFGRPGQGVHARRVLGLAAVDVVGTVVIGLLAAWVGGFTPWKAVALAFLAGVVAHRLFCVRTTVDRLLFG